MENEIATYLNKLLRTPTDFVTHIRWYAPAGLHGCITLMGGICYRFATDIIMLVSCRPSNIFCDYHKDSHIIAFRRWL